jgi:hypothetical protein
MSIVVIIRRDDFPTIQQICGLQDDYEAWQYKRDLHSRQNKTLGPEKPISVLIEANSFRDYLQTDGAPRRGCTR